MKPNGEVSKKPRAVHPPRLDQPEQNFGGALDFTEICYLRIHVYPTAPGRAGVTLPAEAVDALPDDSAPSGPEYRRGGAAAPTLFILLNVPLAYFKGLFRGF